MRNKSNGYSIRSSGFVLVIILIMLGISSLVSLSIINGSSLQERITGNQQKELNARMQAERGVYAAYDYLAVNNIDGVALDDLKKGIGALSQVNASGDGWNIISSELAGKELRVVSKGLFASAEAYLVAKINLISSEHIFENGVVGCDGIALKGGVTIDSYNSKNGPYTKETRRENAHVSTINAGGDIALSGGSDIHGNVTSMGDVSYDGSSYISGNGYATDNFTASGTSSLGGNLQVGGNLSLVSSAKILGDANVVGDVSGGWDTKINGALQYGGALTSSNPTSLGSSQSQQANSLPALPKRKCDPLDIVNKAAPLKTLAPSADVTTDYWQNSVGEKYSYNITPTHAEVFDSNGYAAAVQKANQEGKAVSSSEKFVTPLPAAANQALPFMNFASSTPIHVFENLEVKNGGLTISGGHVVIYVKGDVLTAGGAPRITIEPGSSLTLLVDGKVNIASDTVVMNNNLGMVDNKPSLAIYSTYLNKDEKSDYGVDISGAGNMYAQVYAPNTNVRMNASGTLSGAVRGKTVELDGAGQMHYDEALSEPEFDTGERFQAVASMHYYYPN